MPAVTTAPASSARTEAVAVPRPTEDSTVQHATARTNPRARNETPAADRITAQDSIDAARALHQTLDFVRSAGRSRSLIMHPDGSTSAFAAELPYRMDDPDVPQRVLSIIDAPRSEYMDYGVPRPDPFTPERLRLHMLTPDVAVVTFELQNESSIGRRTLVLRRSHGVWYLAHVHASSVPRRATIPTARCEYSTNQPPPPPLDGYALPSRRPAGPGIGGVFGVVADAATGRPIPAATVVIERISGPVPEMKGDILRTDSSGVFSSTLPTGRYAVKVGRILYDPVSDTVSVRQAMDTIRLRLVYRRCVGP